MATTKKRRIKKNRPHQTLKKGSGETKQINWTRIAVITIGIVIALSMLLSLIVVPGSFGN